MIKKVFLRRRENEVKDVIRDFLNLSKKSFYAVGFFSLFTNILMLLPAIYMLAVYDIVVPSRSFSTLVFITLLVVFLFFISSALQIIRKKIMVRINNKIDSLLNEKVIDAMYEFARKHPSKASVQPFQDFRTIKEFLTGNTIFAFFDAPWIPIYLGVLFLFHPFYGWMAVGVIILVLSMTILNEIVTKKYFEKANNSLIKSNKFLANTTQNVEVIKSMGMKKNIYKKWFKIYEDFLLNYQIANDKATFWSNNLKTTRTLSQSLMLGLGGFLAINLQISSGMIVAGSIVLGRALAPLDILVTTWKSFSNARLAYRRLNALLSDFDTTEKEIVKLPPPKGSITLKEVIVIPPDSTQPALENINLHINAGEFVAVIGPSGAGKSTLARTILGIWEPANGSVEIDGADLRQWDSEYLGRYIGYLPQDIELFEGTIAENIARFEEFKDEDVINAAKLTGAHDFIIKFPHGYNTYLGPGGITLSGGQRQRIGLSRAIYGNPNIIVLDEPNSNLDDEGERALINTLKILKQQKKTVILISHKVNVLSLVDKILVLRNGRVAMFGEASLVIQKLLQQNQNRG